ncbi:hypothetical protein [Amycolatopsis regifaucium]|uniref:DUF4352 domain-containing protein n=1 Tax=Amycolatopsis regifaucium TaxID=546365 RepID=A0A154MWF8_9PSEU|nr:hypothetical protein [Amycolatopsis regifaucium]KZB88605.1 hypothetical protein AVL48_00555 [Amycolatopsis regifaucium]OKA07224.1 hypothetical protein ATP06_0215235 [Amycolatopsis regifaucium]SFI53159.1 hypothetical protein SAMN04489731_111109 [Amycolatopsis regifaucium]
MKSARTALIATACAAALLLSACGEEAGGKTVRADGTLAPGSELRVGERAVVPFSDAGKSGTIAITVKSVDVGPKEDLAKFKDKGEGTLPVYVRMVIENVGGTDLADTSVSVRAVDASGKGTKVIMAGGTAACKGETAPETFTTPGATYETCDTEGVKDGNEVGGVSFGEGDGYKDDPITWKK